MMIRGIENLGVLKIIGDKLIAITTGKIGLASIAVVWISALFTSVMEMLQRQQLFQNNSSNGI